MTLSHMHLPCLSSRFFSRRVNYPLYWTSSYHCSWWTKTPLPHRSTYLRSIKSSLQKSKHIVSQRKNKQVFLKIQNRVCTSKFPFYLDSKVTWEKIMWIPDGELAQHLRALAEKDEGLIPSTYMEAHHLLGHQARKWCTIHMLAKLSYT